MKNLKNFLLLVLLLPALSTLTNCQARKQAHSNRSNSTYLVTKQKFLGTSSWYGPGFHGRRTANGERYNMYGMTAAHKSLPFGTILQVKNLTNNKKVIVTVNDRGPYIGGRVLDLSYGAAKKLGLDRSGTARVEAKILKKNPTQSIN